MSDDEDDNNITTGIGIGIFIVAFLFVFLSFAAPAKSHSWYHPDCCSDKDCYPVEVKPFGNGMLEFKTKSGILILNIEQYRDKMLPSQDQDYHICINGGRVLCIYVPAGT